MREGFEKTVQFDDRVESYATFFDHAWARRLLTAAGGSRVASIAFNLTMNWKAAANTHVLPGLLVECVAGSQREMLRSTESDAEKAIRLIRPHITAELKNDLSNAKRRRVDEALATVAGKVPSHREEYEPTVDPQAILAEFLNSDGGHELKVAVWGSQRIVFGALFHAYEDFVRQCVEVVNEDPNYVAPIGAKLVKAVENAFDGDVCNTCVRAAAIDRARVVRNALAHHGGRVTTEVAEIGHDVMEVDGELQILPLHNRELFDVLKRGAETMATAAIGKLSRGA
jgi:vacuolar-type H+-ATPase subunit E/Vma4